MTEATVTTGGVLAGRAICERLHHHGHDVLTTHLLADDVDDAESQLTEGQVFRRDIEWMSECAVLVAEASGSSYGVGFEMGYVLGRARTSGQRVVLVDDASRRPSISRLIPGNCDAACTRFAYTSLEELRAFVDRHFLGKGPPGRSRATDHRLMVGGRTHARPVLPR